VQLNSDLLVPQRQHGALLLLLLIWVDADLIICNNKSGGAGLA
jgi:hypothetical protein